MWLNVKNLTENIFAALHHVAGISFFVAKYSVLSEYALYESVAETISRKAHLKNFGIVKDFIACQ